MTRVSIITPSFNQAETIESTIQSVLCQAHPSIQYIVIDGGSTDGSVDILRRYSNSIDYWISEPDRGQSHAINKGLRLVDGDLVTWLNSDDMLEVGAVCKVVQLMDEAPNLGIVYGNIDFIDADDCITRTWRPGDFDLTRLVLGNSIPQPGTFVRSSVFSELSGVSESLHFVMDYDLWLRAALLAEIGYLDQTLARFRMSLQNKSVAQHQCFGPEEVDVLASFFSRPDVPTAISVLRDRALARACWRSAVAFALSGNAAMAYEYSVRAVLGSNHMLERDYLASLLLADDAGHRSLHEAEHLLLRLKLPQPAYKDMHDLILRNFYVSRFFRAHNDRSPKTVLSSALPALLRDSSLAGNRGYWSILIHSALELAATNR